MWFIYVKQMDNYEMRVVSRRKKGEVVTEFPCYVLEGFRQFGLVIYGRVQVKGLSC